MKERTLVLIARAPMRISFSGGGTDLPSYYRKYGGMVVSTTINHYAYTILTPGEADSLQVVSADYHTFYRRPPCDDLMWDGDLALPRAVLNYFEVQNGINIFLASQIPPGTGLGSSGSVAVALIKALAFWYGLDLSPYEVAEMACFIEIEKMGMPVGKQDQYAAAFGGLNSIVFEKDGTVRVEPLSLPPSTLEAFQKRMMLFFTGTSRKSSSILRYQQRASEMGEMSVVERLHAIKELAVSMKKALEKGDLDRFGELLHLAWLNKRGLAENITNTFIERCYEAARQAGAVGGKITGAGGGGFLMLYCPVEHQADVTDVLESLGLRRLNFAFDHEGVQVMWAANDPVPSSRWNALLSRTAFQKREISV
ncbi:MAG: GHMP kinase [Anaerolineae bacterium]|nr:GHMP kinase [Anaerolineae bacterium]MDH7475514.1 GHMP kinase [Anaerolineae bacterium]